MEVSKGGEVRDEREEMPVRMLRHLSLHPNFLKKKTMTLTKTTTFVL